MPAAPAADFYFLRRGLRDALGCANASLRLRGQRLIAASRRIASARQGCGSKYNNSTGMRRR
ncbi:MAG: hypothetical protein O3B16_02020, partial [Chloroflexi bacterium]|nr:hypothetical protein [Chloroflexota bacterium]